jgi:hypothetical protein
VVSGDADAFQGWQRNGFGLNLHKFAVKTLSFLAAANNGVNTP